MCAVILPRYHLVGFSQEECNHSLNIGKAATLQGESTVAPLDTVPTLYDPWTP